MQQTKTYKFNLIEPSDTFSPDPLNENAQKLEAALGTKADTAQTAAAAAALEQRVQVLELHKMAAGYYIGDGGQSDKAQFIDLGFTPAIVVTDLPNQTHTNPILCTQDYPGASISIVPGGFKVYLSTPTISDSNANHNSLNTKDRKYRYLALC